MGQHVDVAMLDSMVAMTDVVTNLWSLGPRPRTARGDLPGSAPPTVGSMQVVREHQFDSWPS